MRSTAEPDASRPGSRALLGYLVAASVLGAADTVVFIATDPQTALKTSGRATGSLAGLAVWLLLLAVSGRRLAGGDSPRLPTLGLGLAALAALDCVGPALLPLSPPAPAPPPLVS